MVKKSAAQPSSRIKKKETIDKLQPVPFTQKLRSRTRSLTRSADDDSNEISGNKTKAKRMVVTSAQVGLRPTSRKGPQLEQRDDIPPAGKEIGRQRSSIIRSKGSGVMSSTTTGRDAPELRRQRSNTRSKPSGDDTSRIRDDVLPIGRQRSNTNSKLKEGPGVGRQRSLNNRSRGRDSPSVGDSSKVGSVQGIVRQRSGARVRDSPSVGDSSKVGSLQQDNGRQQRSGTRATTVRNNLPVSMRESLEASDELLVRDDPKVRAGPMLSDDWTNDSKIGTKRPIPRPSRNTKTAPGLDHDNDLFSSGSDSTTMLNETSPTSKMRPRQLGVSTASSRSTTASESVFDYEDGNGEDYSRDALNYVDDRKKTENMSMYQRTMRAVDELKQSFFAQCMVVPAASSISREIENGKDSAGDQAVPGAYSCAVPSRFATRRDLSRQLTDAADTETDPMNKVKSTGDNKRGVRWDDEEDTALQARRAKRILSSKRLRPSGENKVVDEEFLTMISTCDARELSAIIKSICTDSNDKFVTMSLSQRFPTSRDKVLEKLTTSRLNDLDMESKFALILVLANQNHHGEVGRYMARLWFSIDQKDRILCENELGLQVAALARRCCSQDLQAFPESLWSCVDDKGKLDLSSLASDDPRDLPKGVRQAGEYAIDTLAKGVLSFFPQNGHGITLIGSPILDLLMDELGIGELKGEIDWRSTQSRFNDISEFVYEIASNIKRNPILLAFGAAWTQLDEFFKQACLPERTVDMEADVRYAVGYCFLHYVLCEAIIMGPRTCDIKVDGSTTEKRSFLDGLLHLLDIKNEKEKGNHDTWIMNSFEKNQIMWLDTYMRSYAQTIKVGGSKADEKLKKGIQTPSMFTLNMLEEMCENVRKGSENNATAGFELLIEPPGSRECDSTLKSAPVKEWVYKTDGRQVRSGVLLYKSPFPMAWNNLYEAWSLASCSNYADSVDFIGMILPPVSSRLGPARKDGLYLSARLVSTYIHMNCTLSARADAKNYCTTATDFRSDVLTQLFGLVNREAGKQYKIRVDNAIESGSSATFKVQAEAKRIAMQSLWATLRSAIWGAKGVKKLPDEVMSKLKRMNDMIEEWGQDIGIV